MNANDLNSADPQLFAAVVGELVRQETHIELIASENYASSQVMSLQGASSPTNMLKAIRGNVLRRLRTCRHHRTFSD